jgi:uncharacterized membrane protein
VTILIVWIQHHRIFGYIRRVDNVLLILNGFTLLGVTLMPFTNGLLGYSLAQPAQLSTAVLIYIALYILLGTSFNLLWWYASSGRRLLNAEADARQINRVRREYVLGTLTCCIAFVGTFYSWVVGIIVCAGMFGFFAIAGLRDRAG